MKYKKLIGGFLFLNLFLVFSMIFISNKTREIEKINNSIIIDISKIKEDLKINKIELITHMNKSYLEKLYNLYFLEVSEYKIPRVVSIDQLLENNQNIKLANTEN